ncbi:MAG: DUF1385 domain-containing protein [Candidatus Woesearchaeota archaeon]
MGKKLNIGGQALIEGLMIKSPKFISIGLRLPNNKIKVKVDKYVSLTEKNKLLKLPFIRGIIILIEMLYIGMKYLIYSSNEQDDEEESLSMFSIITTILISLLFALLIFKAVPLFMTTIIGNLFTINNLIFNLIDGILRIFMFIIYIILISKMDDVKTLFAYHGAEHATISCYENNKKLTVDNVSKFSTLHSRCGTSFLVITLFISILIFSIVPFNMPYWQLFIYRLPLVFPIAGVSYEILKFSSKFSKYWFFRQVTKPGLLVQKITTKKPNKKQIEVAIKTLKALLKKEKVDY